MEVLMNKEQKAFLPICIIVWTVTALVSGLLIWVIRLAYSDELQLFPIIWVGTDLVLLHILAIAVFGVLSIKLLEHLLFNLTGKTTNAPK